MVFHDSLLGWRLGIMSEACASQPTVSERRLSQPLVSEA
jgi:hypothetical protein